MAVIDVTDYGADPTGKSDCFESVLEAVRHLDQGDTLKFPEGTFWTAPRTATNISNFVRITQSNITIEGPGLLRNVMFDVRGSHGSLGSILGCYQGGVVELTGAEELLAGDYIQLISNVNAYSDCIPHLQGGSRSPGNDILYRVPFAEFRKVRRLELSSVHLDEDLIFDAYSKSSSDLPGEARANDLDRSGYRKINFVSGVTFRRLRFDMSEHKYFRSIRFSLARDCKVSECEFMASDLPGRHVMAGDCLRVTISSNQSTRRPGSAARGSSWNSFLFGAGCQDIAFIDNRVSGDWQAIDFTSFGNSELFGEDSLGGTHWRTTQNIRIEGNYFSNCNDAITTHPGTYFTQISSNAIRASRTGMRIRSRINSVLGNTVESSRFGVMFSSFFDGTLLGNNAFRRSSRHESSTRGWSAIGAMLTSQETMTNNAVSNVLIVGNTALDPYGKEDSKALLMFHEVGITPRAVQSLQKVIDGECDVRFRANCFGGLSLIAGPDVRGIHCDDDVVLYADRI